MLKEGDVLGARYRVKAVGPGSLELTDLVHRRRPPPGAALNCRFYASESLTLAIFAVRTAAILPIS